MRPRVQTLENAMKNIVKVTESGCWIWMGATFRKDYGNLRVNMKNMGAHKYIYEQIVRPVPDGLELDHLCRVPCCVNPDHLEPVTHRENALRGVSRAAINARKTHCPKGHQLAGGNLYIEEKNGARHCRTCRKRVTDAFNAKRKKQ